MKLYYSVNFVIFNVPPIVIIKQLTLSKYIFFLVFLQLNVQFFSKYFYKKVSKIVLNYFSFAFSSYNSTYEYCYFYYYLFILFKIGSTISNVGLLPGSSLMHILISFERCGEISDGIVTLKPSKAT